jgi:hypothetical protein
MLAYLNKQASISCIARDRRQDKKAQQAKKVLLLSMLAYIHKQALA